MTAERILIVGPSWVGDMVMAQSLCIDLKQRQPTSELHMLAPAWTSALVDRMPEINSLIAADFKHGRLHLGERRRVARELRDLKFDQAIVLPNSLKSALVPFLARIPRRTGWLGEQRWGLLNDVRRLDKKRWPMTVQRFVALGRAPNEEPMAVDQIPIPQLALSSDSNAMLASFGLTADSPVLALCPGAEFGASKQWPERHYAQLAQDYLDQGWQVWLLGSTNDAASCARINSATNEQCFDLSGRTTLPQAVDLLAQTALVVSNDSGLMHIAAALNRPLVAIYGSTDPGHTPPLSLNHRIARLGLSCSPCFKRECPLEHLRCLNDLTPDAVQQQAQVLVAEVS